MLSFLRQALKPLPVSAAERRAVSLPLHKFTTVTTRTREQIQPNAPPAPAPRDVPERCCVYCGHALYAPRRALIIRCPKCFTQIHVKDVLIENDLDAPRTITAGKIIVGPEARVRGDLIACHIVIAGRVLGEVLASHSCRVTATGKVAGRILSRQLAIAPGAIVEGQVELVDS